MHGTNEIENAKKCTITAEWNGAKGGGGEKRIGGLNWQKFMMHIKYNRRWRLWQQQQQQQQYEWKPNGVYKLMRYRFACTP